jgi:hypothetical protein
VITGPNGISGLRKMETLFDVVTVTCFVGLVIAFFRFTNRNRRTLIEFVAVGLALAVANQVGNAGQTVLAVALILGSLGFVALAARS